MSIFNMHGLKIYDVEKIDTHGGSLRIYGAHSENTKIKISDAVNRLLIEEKEHGLQEIETYRDFKKKVESIKFNVLEFLINHKKSGKKIVAYGAAAKGMTLLNYVGIGPDLIDCIYDQAPMKIGRYSPGRHIPIVSPSNLEKDQPDMIIIFPWNIASEIEKLIAKYLKKETICVTFKDVIEQKVLCPVNKKGWSVNEN